MMIENKTPQALILGLSLIIGLAVLGYLLGNAAITYKEYERTITVKGLSEREYQADVVIWPIRFNAASNNLNELYNTLEISSEKIKTLLTGSGITADEISTSLPEITDKSAQQYGNQARAQYRYSAFQTVTVYSKHIAQVQKVMAKIPELGKQGIVFVGNNYQAQTEYIFTRLNEVKPAMIEEATRKAREVAEKFAADSQSVLGKIKSATQGQFSIRARDKNTPHIKKIRVVSTIVYYLSD